MNGRPWLRALGWLAFLGPFFFLTYNYANQQASHRSDVAVLMFRWERYIPFLGWTILPYWSSDLLYALSFAFCRTREEVDRHGLRLLAIQVFATACFLLFPALCVFQRPALDAWVAALFGALGQFDLPYNQAPSLHVALAVILWALYRRHVSGALRWCLGAWFVLVATSSVTTYQHHVIDVVTGAWAGVLTLALMPEVRLARPRVRLVFAYLTGAIACTAAAFAYRWWILLWPGFALSMVAAAYWTGDPSWLRSRWLMFPYTAVAWINSRLWTRGQPAKNLLTDSVWIGRAPSRRDREGIQSVVALAPELAVTGDASIAMLDLVPPSAAQLEAAVEAILQLKDRRPTLVCCALGYSRAAITSAAWLIASGHAGSVSSALEQVRRARPQVVLRPEFESRLSEWAESRNG